MGKVLVLNASYEPLNITSWRRAVVLLLKDKAESLEHNGRVVHRNFPLPTVIRLRQYIKIPYREIPLTRKNILERDRQTCQYCLKRGEQLTLDHILPKSRGGADSWENLVTACMRCNVHKGNRTPKEAEMSLNTKPRKPYSSLYFELVKHTRGEANKEWKKYVIGMNDVN
ncbi:HNH endonuclease [[Leptolyngbya] sp. PCC 7376]|uniref:HNH endonuclease n=1 Tax=[Leptolyngbya] sp. PCC 7376 TaxID=111781 RepID=UPI00029F1061|nr:HNH endonuclease [[Leptolyngbya] sp. PCC 7376]AFY36678.1 HNH endonuclease [[Leptolyngbya] sp. PCC 7376]